MLRVTGLCEEDLPVTGEFPSQRASNAENVSIWWRHHDQVTRQPQLRDRKYKTIEVGEKSHMLLPCVCRIDVSQKIGVKQAIYP